MDSNLKAGIGLLLTVALVVGITKSITAALVIVAFELALIGSLRYWWARRRQQS